MNKVIRGGAREKIYKVFMRCMAEYQAEKLLSDLDDAYKRTAQFTGVSLSTVRRIVQQGMKKIGKEYYDRGRTLYNDIDELVTRIDTDTTDCDTDSDESLLEMYTSKDSLGASTSQEPSTMEGVEFSDFELLHQYITA